MGLKNYLWLHHYDGRNWISGTRLLAKKLFSRFSQPLNNRRKWYEDLCEYYKVTPKKAGELGGPIRHANRRPNFPGSPTTDPVTGMKFEEIWEKGDRTTVEGVLKFQKDLGAWSSFRQLYYHRHDSFWWVVDGLPPGTRICEYACGTGPISNWIAENIKDRHFYFTIADLDCEHRAFGLWRLRERVERNNSPSTVKGLISTSDKLPLDGEYDVITITEALVLIHNPIEVVKHLTEHLRKGGKFWETYTVLDDHRTEHWLSFREAQKQRSAVFKFIRLNYKLLEGPDPDCKQDAGRRCWGKL